MTLTPNSAEAISVGYSSAQAGTFSVESGELANITAGTVTIGSTSLAGGLTVGGNIGVSGTVGTTAGAYNLNLYNAGNINSSGNTFTEGSNAINVTSGGNISITTSGSNQSINLGTVNSGGTTTIATGGASSTITTSGAVTSADTLNIHTANNPSGGGITLGGTVTGGGSNSFTLESWYGNLSVTGDIDDNSTAGTTLIEAGFYNAGSYLGNSAVTYSVSGNVNIASGFH